MDCDYLEGIDLEEGWVGVESVLREHSEVRILFERRHSLPRPVEIGGVNPILHVIMEGIVENQLNDPRFPEVREAVERLQQQGLTRHAARANVARLFIEFFHEACSRREAFDEEGYRSQVRLVGTDLAGTGRNRPCPCGSGKKFKLCCGSHLRGFRVHRFAGALCLGQGGYLLAPPDSVVEDPLDPLLQLENRVHIARYLEEHGDVEGALKALEENVTLAESVEGGRWLNNALQDLQLLCYNHPGLEEKGIEASERLMALAESEGDRGNYWCDKADLLARLGRVEEAEQEYQGVFKALPNWHFGRYRYALYLEERGKKEEALPVLRELVACRDAVDEETYAAASEVLEDLEGD